ncbi:MAG: 4Fe-4S dicluster domain-containing protein [Bacillota bacterium]
MADISRRSFLKRSIASGVAAGVVISGAGKLPMANGATEQKGTVIDLTRCDGCPKSQVPLCVEACRTKNRDRYPKPVENIQDYWPHKKHEDWSDKKHLTDRLTPYNWTFVQRVSVEHQGKTYQLFIPRRCMHCDNPPCARLCPFSAQEKKPEGPVVIDENGCFGGAKCRDVCPWKIPQRQAGVGVYLKLAPKYIGGGVMYKCDLCYDLVRAGKQPACVEACPQKAIVFGGKTDLGQFARQRAEEIGGYIYGDRQNGGTSTLYISPVPFDKINQALTAQEAKPGMNPEVENFMDTANGMAKGFLVAPIAGVFAAGWAAVKTMKGEN